MGLVATLGSRMTPVSVRIDDERRTMFELGAARRQARQLVLARHWSGGAVSHVVRVVIRDAARPRVDVDGFMVLTEAPAP